jgi:hypothetical protein
MSRTTCYGPVAFSSERVDVAETYLHLHRAPAAAARALSCTRDRGIDRSEAVVVEDNTVVKWPENCFKG